VRTTLWNFCTSTQDHCSQPIDTILMTRSIQQYIYIHLGPRKNSKRIFICPDAYTSYTTLAHFDKYHLQLTIRCLGRLLAILVLELGLLLTLPVDRLQSLSQNWMRIVVARVEEVSVHGGKILDLELDEGLSKFCFVSEFEGEVVCT
jgi:hypothetical protein